LVAAGSRPAAPRLPRTTRREDSLRLSGQPFTPGRTWLHWEDAHLLSEPPWSGQRGRAGLARRHNRWARPPSLRRTRCGPQYRT